MTEQALQIALAVGLGALSGVLGGLFGIGGGVIVIPLLALFGLHQQLAQGTALVMVVPNVLLAIWRYRQRVGLDFRIALTLAGSAMLSTYPVARIATALDPHALRLAFAGFLGILAATLAYRTGRDMLGSPGKARLDWGWTALVGVIGGAISGLFGVGGAFIVPPALTRFFGVRQVEAQGLGLALVAPGSVVALATYAAAGEVEWGLGLPLAIGGAAAISVGVAAAHRLPERELRFGFCGLLLLTAGLLAAHG